MNFITSIIGERFARPAIFGFVLILVFIAVFSIARCSRDDTAQRQAEQTTQSSDAIANAAEVAIGTIENRTVTEKDIDHATAIAEFEINEAADAATVRAAVLGGVCGQTSHRNDPACAVR